MDYYVDTYNLNRTKRDLVNIIVKAAERNGVDAPLMLSLAKHESSFNPNVVGGTGDIGLFQLNPRYYDRDDAFNAVRASEIASKAIKGYMKRFGVAGDEHLTRVRAIMAYNWGPTNLANSLAAGNGVPASVESYANRVVRDADKFIK